MQSGRDQNGSKCSFKGFSFLLLFLSMLQSSLLRMIPARTLSFASLSMHAFQIWGSRTIPERGPLSDICRGCLRPPLSRYSLVPVQRGLLGQFAVRSEALPFRSEEPRRRARFGCALLTRQNLRLYSKSLWREWRAPA